MLLLKKLIIKGIHTRKNATRLYALMKRMFGLEKPIRNVKNLLNDQYLFICYEFCIVFSTGPQIIFLFLPSYWSK